MGGRAGPEEGESVAAVIACAPQVYEASRSGQTRRVDAADEAWSDTLAGRAALGREGKAVAAPTATRPTRWTTRDRH